MESAIPSLIEIAKLKTRGSFVANRFIVYSLYTVSELCYSKLLLMQGEHTAASQLIAFNSKNMEVAFLMMKSQETVSRGLAPMVFVNQKSLPNKIWTFWKCFGHQIIFNGTQSSNEPFD